jgi:hypothetical protein
MEQLRVVIVSYRYSSCIFRTFTSLHLASCLRVSSLQLFTPTVPTRPRDKAEAGNNEDLDKRNNGWILVAQCHSRKNHYNDGRDWILDNLGLIPC